MQWRPLTTTQVTYIALATSSQSPERVLKQSINLSTNLMPSVELSILGEPVGGYTESIVRGKGEIGD